MSMCKAGSPPRNQHKQNVPTAGGEEESEDHDLAPSSADDDGVVDDDDDDRPRKKSRVAAPKADKKPAKSKGKASPAAAASVPKGGKPAAAASSRAASGVKAGGGKTSGGASSSAASAGAAGVSLPPPGSLAPIAFKKANTVAEAEAVLLAYLKRGNRPYSALQVRRAAQGATRWRNAAHPLRAPLQVFENLHGAVGKTVVPSVLDGLCERGLCAGKLFGKFKLYWADQAQFGETGSVRARGGVKGGADAPVASPLLSAPPP